MEKQWGENPVQRKWQRCPATAVEENRVSSACGISDFAMCLCRLSCPHTLGEEKGCSYGCKCINVHKK